MRQFPTKDIDLVHKNEISERIKSIDRQVDKLESIVSDRGFDARHTKLTKLNIRKDILWRKRAIILRAERK
jgi:hypothetical protein